MRQKRRRREAHFHIVTADEGCVHTNERLRYKKVFQNVDLKKDL